AGDQRLQPALLLFLASEQVKDLPVAGVRGLAVEDVLRPQHAPDLLVQMRVGEKTEPGSPRFRRKVRRPQSFVLRTGAQLGNQLLRRAVLATERRLVRLEVGSAHV